jgi:nitroreductase
MPYLGAVMPEKKASTDYPIHELLAGRWKRPGPEGDLRSLFEAARWASSSYSEQPWSYVVATKDDPDQFELLLSCLVEGN